MPYTLNGIGTWYYGKRERVEYFGTCSQCTAPGRLASYDTRLYFVIGYIPVLPLQRTHVLDDCPSCKRHLAMTLEGWQQALASAAEAERAFDREPASREKAVEAIGARTALRDLPGLRKLAPVVEQRLPGDAELLGALAGVYAGFGDEGERVRLLRAAHAADPDDAVGRERLAGCLLDHRRPDEAAPLLVHDEKDGRADRWPLLRRLAECRQMQGRHEEALRLFDSC